VDPAAGRVVEIYQRLSGGRRGRLERDDLHVRRPVPVFKRHAAAGAALLFTSGPAAGEQIGSYQGEPLYHASLDSDEYRKLLRDNGFTVVAHAVEDPDCGLHTIWLALLD
jgi:hypothetical protein